MYDSFSIFDFDDLEDWFQSLFYHFPNIFYSWTLFFVSGLMKEYISIVNILEHERQT